MTNEQIKNFVEKTTGLNAFQICSCRSDTCFLLKTKNFSKFWRFKKCHKKANGTADEFKPLTDREEEEYLKTECQKILKILKQEREKN